MPENRDWKIGLVGILLGFLGGIISALIGAGVLFPAREWSPELYKKATASVNLKIPPDNFDREFSVQAKVSGVGNRLEPEIYIDGELCNVPNPVYKNPNTSDHLISDDFCLFLIKKDQGFQLEVKSKQKGVESQFVAVTLRYRKASRSLF